jgi:Endonuclease/Exonuclease/phosphatase family
MAMVAIAAPFVVNTLDTQSPQIVASATTLGDVVPPGADATGASPAASSDAVSTAPSESTGASSEAELRADRPSARIARKAERRSKKSKKVRFTIEKGTTLKLVPPPPPEPPKPSGGPFSFRIGSFNVLGSQHTAKGGDRQKFPPASVRTPAAAALVAKHGVDVLGTQELQDDQLRSLQARTGMAAYPGFAWGVKETDNSILWDPGVFEFVSGSSFRLTFMSRSRPQPIVKLRHKATGQEFYVVNTHPSAGGGKYAAQRRAGQSILVGIVRNLKASGLPVFVTGDMNDRQAFYCNVVPAAGLSAPNGGSYGSGCHPPPSPLPVDWVVGTGASWSGYWRDTAPVDRRISDHFFISAMAHVG